MLSASSVWPSQFGMQYDWHFLLALQTARWSCRVWGWHKFLPWYSCFTSWLFAHCKTGWIPQDPCESTMFDQVENLTFCHCCSLLQLRKGKGALDIYFMTWALCCSNQGRLSTLIHTNLIVSPLSQADTVLPGCDCCSSWSRSSSLRWRHTL